MNVWLVVGNKKWDGSYIMGVHKNKDKADEQTKVLNDYNNKIGVKTRYHVEGWSVEE